ncbi:MAG TPA: methyltransferase domain-containing protein [Terracidiphilus sp.]|nr:methyltransferase domain-containing protein [Terracidiphilus sp.]
MDQEALSVLCDPDTRYPLEFDDRHLRNTATGRIFPIRDGIPLFVSTIAGPSLIGHMLYDRLAFAYDFAQGLRRWLTFSPDFRAELVKALGIEPGQRVLEVSVGTGASLPYLPRDIRFFGLDLSWGMLRQCQRNARRWQRQAHLYQGEAERLPFQGEMFDTVFHMCGINAFTYKARAIKEMIWVARPGARIVMIDRARSGSRPAAGEAGSVSGTLADLVPAEMQETRVSSLADGRFFCLSFRKP